MSDKPLYSLQILVHAVETGAIESAEIEFSSDLTRPVGVHSTIYSSERFQEELEEAGVPAFLLVEMMRRQKDSAETVEYAFCRHKHENPTILRLADISWWRPVKLSPPQSPQ